MPTPERVSLCQLPTPLHRLDRASELLGIDLWIKRDDLTGFAGGGNKGRKLEYLMPNLKGAKTVVCSGSTQSNFVRQFGAACQMMGIRCVAVVMDVPYPDGQSAPLPALASTGANAALDRLFEVEIHKVPNGTWSELDSHAVRIAKELGAVVIPLGGGTREAVFAFIKAAEELHRPFDQIVVPCSSGSTYVGLSMAFQGSETKVIGISADPEPDMVQDLLDLSLLASSYLPALREVDFRTDWVGPGYGVPSEDGERARRWLAQTEGIVLDPVYTGKAFAALLDLAKRGELPGRTLFWHTGGLPLACLPASEPG